MRGVTSIELMHLTQEAQILVGSRLDKAYHPRKEEIVLQFGGRKLLRIISGKALWITELKEQYATPGGFCMQLRKELGNVKLIALEQMGTERVAVLRFSAKDGEKRLYIELFGQGNIVLTDENDTIITALAQKKWKDRTIMKGERYEYPHKDFDFDLDKQAFSAFFSGSDVVTALAKEIGLGGPYAEEVCTLAGVDKKKAKVSEKEISALYRAYRDLLERGPSPVAIRRGKEIIAVLPFPLQGKEGEAHPSMSAAYDAAFAEQAERVPSPNQKLIGKVKKVISAQQESIAKLEEQAASATKAGELIYEHYQDIEKLLGMLQDTDLTKVETKGKVVAIDPKKKTVTIEL